MEQSGKTVSGYTQQKSCIEFEKLVIVYVSNVALSGMYPVIQLVLFAGYFVVRCDNIFTSLPNYPEVKLKLPKLRFEKLDHIMSHTTGSFCSKPVITNLEQLFFTINKYKKYLYKTDAGRIYHCKLLGQFEFKSEF